VFLLFSIREAKKNAKILHSQEKKTHSFSVELIAVIAVVPSVVLSNMIRESLQNIH
jgi:hypothetical protein